MVFDALVITSMNMHRAVALIVMTGTMHVRGVGDLFKHVTSLWICFVNNLGVFQRPLTLILLQIGGVYTTFCQEEGILLQKYAIEMGGVSRYFSKVSGSGVDVTLLNNLLPKQEKQPPSSTPKYRGCPK